MSPIISSVVVSDQPQIDGRRWIRERHTDHMAVVYFRDYMAAAGLVIADGFPAVVAILNQQLIDAEIARDLASIYESGNLAVVTTDYVTLPDIRAPLRDAHRTGSR